MSRNNRITNAKAQKLRSGHTYWRCQIQEDGTVSISEAFLKGSKFTTVSRSMFPEDAPKNKRKVLYTSLVIGPVDPKQWTRRSYLSSVNPGSSINTFSTRRAAQRWKREVEAGLHPEAVANAMEHWDFCNDLSYGMDYYDDPLYDYDGGPYNGVEDYSDPHSEVVAREPLYSEPTTLGSLLRKKLDQMEQDADKFPEESCVGTDVKPLLEVEDAPKTTVRRIRRTAVV